MKEPSNSLTTTPNIIPEQSRHDNIRPHRAHGGELSKHANEIWSIPKFYTLSGILKIDAGHVPSVEPT